MNRDFRDAKTTSFLGEQTELQGDLEIEGGIRIDGHIVGDVHCKSVIYLGETGSIKGNVVAEALISSGKVEGNVVSRQHVQVSLPGSIKGDIETAELVLEKGVFFDGQCRMVPLDKA
jgi:cytoskeletal protein CcmA (bactofilin family)